MCAGCFVRESLRKRTIKYLNLPYPIIIDSFREGKIDSSKEERMITLFKELDCQVIVSATLKDSELSANKYSSRNDLNAIDYGSFQENHILSPNYVAEFKTIMASLGLKIGQSNV